MVNQRQPRQYERRDSEGEPVYVRVTPKRRKDNRRKVRHG